MQIDAEFVGLALAILGHVLVHVEQRARMVAQIEALKEQLHQIQEDGLPERTARIEQAVHDVRNSLQRIESRLHIGVPAE